MWIATVVNSDWPKRKGLSSEEQKQEYITLIDSLKKININTLFVQIRPSADAFYPSNFEPWSEFITGTQGVPPSPYYDPLKFMIDEAHKRGMEFHAWINPYRAIVNISSSSISFNSPIKKHPHWFVRYGHSLYFDPGLPQVRNFIISIVKDLINRYNIDGIHLDDYFYPYPENNLTFNDLQTWKLYGNGLNISNWRRSNCDSLIHDIHNTILQTKPMIRFGVSPFGIWRNLSNDPVEGSKTNGLSGYDDIYANVILWLKKGWIDYVVPQIYWSTKNVKANYKVLVDWWSKHSYGKDVYIGIGIYRSIEHSSSDWKNKNELSEEIKFLHQYKTIKGCAFFSSKDLIANPNGWKDSLVENYFKYPSLIPQMRWIDMEAPSAPEIWLTNNLPNKDISFDCALIKDRNDHEVVKNCIVYFAEDPINFGTLPKMIIPNFKNNFSINIIQSLIPKDWTKLYISVSLVDNENNESTLSNFIRFIKLQNGLWIGINER